MALSLEKSAFTTSERKVESLGKTYKKKQEPGQGISVV
jgi:hypothetical protein